MLRLKTALTMSAFCSLAMLASADTMEVSVNKTYPIQLNGKATTVIIGDTDVADVTAPSEDLILVQGVGVGATNLVVLDNNANELINTDILVSPDNEYVLYMQRGTSVFTYTCTPRCSQATNF